MKLRDIMEIWNLNTGTDIFDDITLNAKVNKSVLIDFLVSEYGDMQTVESYSTTMHQKILNFFLVHKWNIDKLCDTLDLDYNPIWTHDNYTDTTWARDETINTDIKEDEDWTEKGHTDETDINGVSAYNDLPATLDSPIDTEHHRDIITVDYSKEGTDDKTTDKDQVEDEDYKGNVHKYGHDANKSYQELIEEERKQAEFNIYKWISYHFARELVLAIW